MKKFICTLTLISSFIISSHTSFASAPLEKTNVINPVNKDSQTKPNADTFPALYNLKGEFSSKVECEKNDNIKDCKLNINFKNAADVPSSSLINNLINAGHVVHVWKTKYYEFLQTSNDSYLYFLDDKGNFFRHRYITDVQRLDAIRDAEKAGARITVLNHWYNYIIGFMSDFSIIFSMILPILICIWLITIVKKFFVTPAEVINASGMPSFDDVAGNEYVKGELKTIAEAFKKGDKHPKNNLVPSGILLLGPPGNGKTLMASALAHEINGGFLAINGADFVEMFAGLGPRRVNMTFKKARSYGNCVIFIDEIDAIGKKREGSGGDSASLEWVNTLNKLLDCIDGIKTKKKNRGLFRKFLNSIGISRANGRVIVVGATNRAEVLDPALTRSGRLEKSIHVPLPDHKTRMAIAKIHMKKFKVSEDFDYDLLARSTSGMSGADIEYLCKESQKALLNRQDDANSNHTVIDMHCFNDALDMKLLGPQTGINIDEDTASMIAVHEGGHAFMAIHEFSPQFVRRITIEPRGHALGFVAMVPVKDRQSQTLKEIRSTLRIQVAGRVAEEIFRGEDNITTGAIGDIKQATALARAMVMNFGLSESIGMVDVSDNDFNNPVSEETRRNVDRAVHKEITDAKRYVKMVLTRNSSGIHLLVKSLLKKPTQQGTDIAHFMRVEDVGNYMVDDIIDTGTHSGSDASPGSINSFNNGIIS